MRPMVFCFRGVLAGPGARGIAGLIADRSVLKRDPDEIALPPDYAALANGVKFVEGQFEIQRQQIEAIEFNAGPGIGDVLNAAGEDAALRIKEQQRVFRNRRPCDRSAFQFHPIPAVHAYRAREEATVSPPGGNQLRSSS
jgi:hypothetical protein